MIRVNGIHYRASWLIWFMQTGKWPAKEVDHRNRKRSDDKWKNLREADHGQNQHNKNRYKNNKSGITGVTWHKQHQKWYVTIQRHRRPIFIGLYSSKRIAKQAYQAAAKKHFGEFARAA